MSAISGSMRARPERGKRCVCTPSSYFVAIDHSRFSGLIYGLRPDLKYSGFFSDIVRWQCPSASFNSDIRVSAVLSRWCYNFYPDRFAPNFPNCKTWPWRRYFGPAIFYSPGCGSLVFLTSLLVRFCPFAMLTLHLLVALLRPHDRPSARPATDQYRQGDWL